MIFLNSRDVPSQVPAVNLVGCILFRHLENLHAVVFQRRESGNFLQNLFAHLGTKGVRHSENAYENMEVNPNFGMKKMPQTFQNSRRNLGEVKVPKMCSF